MDVKDDLFACTNCGSVIVESGYNHIGYVEEMDAHYIKEGACPACGKSNAELRKLDV